MRTKTRSPLRLITVMFAISVVLLAGGCKSDNSASSTSTPAKTTATAAVDSSADFTCPASNTIAFAKTKFVTHAGLGIGAFHRWIYKPARNGGFKKGADGRVKAFVKAGAAALFVKREVRLASNDAKANPTLCKAIVAPMKDISDKISGAVAAAKNGDTSKITSLESDVTSIMSSSKRQGDTITPDENADITSH